MNKKQINYIYITLIVILIAVSAILYMNSKNHSISDALDKIAELNTENLLTHHEHDALLLSNGDMIEFSRDISISDADVIMLINVAGIDENIINIENVPGCPPPDQEMETGKFCYVPSNIIAQEEPHLAEVYPEGILIRSFNVG